MDDYYFAPLSLRDFHRIHRYQNRCCPVVRGFDVLGEMIVVYGQHAARSLDAEPHLWQ